MSETQVGPVLPEMSFSAPLMRWADSFTSKRDVRYYLGGVLVQPAPSGGVFLAGTDGHRLIIAHDKDGMSNGKYLIKPNTAAVKSCHSRYEEVSALSARNPVGMRVAVKGTRLTVFDNRDQEHFVQAGSCIKEGVEKYPNAIERFMPPDRENLVPAGDKHIYPGILVEALKPFCSTGRKFFNAVRMWKKKDDEGGTIYLEIDGLPVLVVVMPCRGDAQKGNAFWKPEKK